MNEKQNTFNTLANKPLLVSSIWCKIGIHNWQKWSDPISTIQEGYMTRLESIQERFCNNCNKHNVRNTRNVRRS